MASRPTPLRPGRFLPRDPRIDAPYRLTPQLVFRIGILGFLTLAVFAVLFVRLWALQVLSGNEFLVAAQNNQLRVFALDAPRGPIEDRNGRVLVENTSATAVKIWPADLPEARRLRRAAPPRADPRGPARRRHARRSRRTAATRSRRSPSRTRSTRARCTTCSSTSPSSPGMTITNTYVRQLPVRRSRGAHPRLRRRDLAEDQLKTSKGYVLGDKIGQAGIEAVVRQGAARAARPEQLRVDSLGRPISPIEPREPTTPGYAVRLTLDTKLQRAAQQAVIDGINRAQANHQWYAKAGAIVALDPRDGAIRALASYPTYDPAVYTSRKKSAPSPPLPRSDRREGEQLSGPRPRDRGRLSARLDVQARDRARRDAGAHPLAVPVAPVHAARTRSRARPSRTGTPLVNQPMTLPTALAQSCDTYFYQVGKSFYDLPADRGQPLQKWAKNVRLRPSSRGSMSAPRPPGLLPTIDWKHADVHEEDRSLLLGGRPPLEAG